jgi:uncharacterized protein YciI
MKSYVLTSLAGAMLVATPLALGAQQQAVTPQPAAPPGYEIPKDMTTYYLATYVRGPKFMANDSPEHQALTKQHLSFIRKMIEEKKYLIAGPFMDDGPQLGMAIVSAPDADEAKRIAAADPAIAAGHMAVDVRAAMLPSLSSLVVKY